MDIRKLQRVIVNALDDVKAQDIVVYNTKHLTSEFERVNHRDRFFKPSDPCVRL